ncbi:MAG TPA: hypothetical protein VK588_02150 [Chitinophagaceae bacterium]|nr:hypothetical protein [Chitinophagaceae bacterium]
MKIVFVCHDANLTGAPKVGFEIARHLSYNNEVVMVVKKQGLLAQIPEYQDAFRIFNSNTSHEIEGPSKEERSLIAMNFLQKEKPDLLYVNSVASSDWCKEGKRLGIPVVLHSHEMKRELLSLESVGIFSSDLSLYVDLLISVSPDAEDDIISLCSTPFKKIFLSTPGIDFMKLEKQAISENYLRPMNFLNEEMPVGNPVLAMCGIASQRKGSDIFLQVARKFPHLSFLWIGPWSRREAPGNIALSEFEKSPLPNFYMTNETLNPYPYFALTDLFILTSREDPNPLVLMEALLLCKLCMGFSNTGGSKDLLTRFGLLLQGSVDVDRIVSIVEKIQFPLTVKFVNQDQTERFRMEYDIKYIAQSIEEQLVFL